jgi:Dolichyl-phosphate-mannose-protein mannosyltransferase
MPVISAQLAPASSENLEPSDCWLNPPRMVCVALLCLTVIFFAVIRYRLRAMPLERDEGEYAYAGQLLLEHIPPYKLAYNMKLPGIYTAYATILAAFGQTPTGIHLGLLLINAATTWLIYLLAARLFGRLAGLIAGASYALLSTSSSVMGFEAHATHFVVLPALAGILVLLQALESRRPWRLFSSGLLCGLSVLMKQHGAFFALFCGCYLIAKEWKLRTGLREICRDATIFSAGVVLPYAITCLLLYRAGVFSEFWFWTVSYANEYSKMGLRRGLAEFLDSFNSVNDPVVPMWILAGFGMTALWWAGDARRHRGFLLSLFGFSFLALCPGAYFREHYFILLLPVVAILIAVAIVSVTKRVAALHKTFVTFAGILIFLACFYNGVSRQSDVYFTMSAEEAMQSTYNGAPFLPITKISQYVKDNSAPTASIAVFGSEPEIYFYTHRHSATGYLYMYSMIERQKYTARMQQQMMREIENNRPDYIVYVDFWDSWGERDDAPHATGFLAWMQNYMQSNYERVAVADGPDHVNYSWGNAAKTYQPLSTKVIYVLKRKS